MESKQDECWLGLMTGLVWLVLASWTQLMPAPPRPISARRSNRPDEATKSRLPWILRGMRKQKRRRECKLLRRLAESEGALIGIDA